MKKLFLYVIGSLIILPVYSQHLIKGTIIDSENAVMPMVNVAFLNQADSTLVTGAVSDSCGVYGTSLAGGNYIIRYSYLGYETLCRNIQVNANLTLPVVKMELAQTELEGVEVTAYRKPFKLIGKVLRLMCLIRFLPDRLHWMICFARYPVFRNVVKTLK